LALTTAKKNGWIDGEAYVLQDFLKEEKEVLENEVFKKIKEKLTTIFAKNIKN